MQVVGLLVDDSLRKSLSFTEETALIFHISDDEGVQEDEDEGNDRESHGEVSESCSVEQTILDTDDETVGTQVVRHEAS